MADGLAPTIKAGTPKLSAKAAGYMELSGAVKDGGCLIVDVPGGISKKLGCCNSFKPQSGAKQFRCGECKFED
jgi:hypothetical protein